MSNTIELSVFLVLCTHKLASSSYYYEEEKLPTFLSASVGEHVVFNCELEFPQDIPIPYILNWRKENRTIFSWDSGVMTSSEPFIGRVHLLNRDDSDNPEIGKASINLTSIRESDAGWYECKIVFPFRSPPTTKNGTWFYLAVNGGNLLEIPPINQTVMEGEDVHFTCISKRSGIEIRWFKDSIPLTELENIFHRSRIDQEGSLTIHSAEMGDLGEYLCEAINYLKESQSARAFLNVQYKAKVIHAPKEVFLPFGQPAILDCNFKANPPLKSLRWEKDGFLFDPYNVPGVFYRQNGSLYFSKVDESHNGHYSCTPYNEFGTQGPSPSIHVIVLRPPVFVTTPQPLYLRRLGETLEIICDARDGDNGHKPIMVWYKKDGSPLPDGRYIIKDGNLTITNVQEEDRGLYQCSATNDAATITTETELLVENVPPRAPYNLTAKASSTSVTLNWIAGRKRPRMKYSVWYRADKAAEWRNIEVRHSHQLEATIYNLQPNRDYEIMVLSEDPHGEALFSKPLRISTLNFEGDKAEVMQAYFPSASQLNITAKLTDKGCLVTWNPPEYGEHYLKYYMLKWYSASSGHIVGTIETINNTFVVPNLEEGEAYEFQVTAIALDEYETFSNRITVSIPAYQKIKLLSFSLVAAVAVIVVTIISVYYVKTKCCQTYSKQTSANTSSS